jgi:alginate O-acetyltransferase complex protein AlgJ
VAVIADKALDRRESENFAANMARFTAETKEFGEYPAWAARLEPLVSAEKKLIAGLPEGQMGFEGKDNWLFFKKSLEYTTAGELTNQPSDKNPLPHLIDLKNYFDSRNINLLFVVIPNKEEVYYEKLPIDNAPATPGAIINPYGRKILRDMQAAGIEVIDLLPAYLLAKVEDPRHAEAVYQKHDTHWSHRGLHIAARMIADRVKQYGWYADCPKTTYTLFDTTFLRRGDIVDRLPEALQPNYPAQELAAQQVKTPDGSLYQAGKDAPIMLMGDSFTGVYQSVDCKGAGVAAHIAAQTGAPVEVITSWGGGPLVRNKMLRARKNDLGAKRLVIYMMVARDLYNYAQSWEPLEAQ